MQRLIQLESKPFTAGGNVGVSLKGLPPKTRVREFLIGLELVFTTGAAQVLIPGPELYRLLANVEAQGPNGSIFKLTGQVIHTMCWMMRGMEDQLTASIPATNATVFRRTPRFSIPFWDMNAWAPADLCPNSEVFNDSTLNIDFAQLGTLTGGSSLSTLTGTVRVMAVVDDANGQASSQPRMGYQDFTSQSVILDPGLYTHIWGVKEDGTAFTSAEVSAFSCRVDGTPVVTTARAEEMAFLHNYLHPTGGAFRLVSATAPIPAEEFTVEPSNAGAAAATVSPELLVLFAPDRGYKLTQALKVDQAIQFDFQGSLSNFRVGFRRVDPRNEATAVSALQALGIPVTSAEAIAAKTESKAPLSAGKKSWTRFFPLRAK
jgi:hypothetical protein